MLTVCTVSGDSGAAGGGLYNSVTTNMYGCTIGSNCASVGGGIDNVAGGRAKLVVTIVGDNTGIGDSPSDIFPARSP
jgi:hypothetical protein